MNSANLRKVIGGSLAGTEIPQEDLNDYIQSLRLTRDIMDLMLRGRSAIDSEHPISLKTAEGAHEFLDAYGYNLNSPVEAAELQGNYHEALRFIRKYFLRPENPEGAELEIPREFFELQDVRNLFLWAADRNFGKIIRARWACSVLRVMHAISHLDKDLRHGVFPEIQKQIFDRFYREIHSEEGTVFLGKPGSIRSIQLVRFQTKPRKTRDSLILKVLHKRDALAEDVFDQIGVRFVTQTRTDVVRVLKYLRDHHIVMVMNIRPSRSRNSLIDPLLYRRKWREVLSGVGKGKFKSSEEVQAMLESSMTDGFAEGQERISESNPFSSSHFFSLQFTCRQLVKYRSPVFADLKSMKKKLKDSKDPDIQSILEIIDKSDLTKEMRFFYPFEVQILDEKNHLEAESGRASHSAYKAAQAQMAMRRVLGPLVKPSHKTP